jgi:hypothetical protein
LVAALAEAQKTIVNPAFDKVNPHFKSKYATLGAHLDVIRDPFSTNGLVLTQFISSDNTSITCTTRISHKSGEWMEDSASEGRPERCTIQQFGSICSYLRRYTIAAAVGIVGEESDDDGEAAVAPQRVAQQFSRPVQQQATAPQRPVQQAPAPQAAPKAAPVARPIATVQAPATPSKATTPPADEYPDEFEGEVTILRVAERKGKPIAIQFDGPHGKAWMTTDVMEYVQFAKDDVDSQARVHLARVDGALTIMRWQAPAPAPTTELPF